MQCIFEETPNWNITYVNFLDGGIYELTCSRGHKFVTFIQNEQYEILYQMGALAFLDGYYRESVSNFAAALERFYEYCLTILLLKNGVEWKEIEQTWKLIKNMSERQLGAYYYLYLNEFKKVPPTFSDNLGFRNKVIHKGYIPKREEVEKYASDVFNYIKNVSEKFRTYCDVHLLLEPHLKRQFDFQNKRQKENVTTTSTSLATMLNITTGEQSFNKSFEESMNSLKKDLEIGLHYKK